MVEFDSSINFMLFTYRPRLDETHFSASCFRSVTVRLLHSPDVPSTNTQTQVTCQSTVLGLSQYLTDVNVGRVKKRFKKTQPGGFLRLGGFIGFFAGFFIF